ncbi:hypothetical protein JOY44_17430 [Phormidium sp. CLA17]|uniref:hypothetical protein n=1 Tax=Leptolyngbya sp. Cla-17 TaxID=2803751 RepID=UPI001490ED69|nr:hypothetical protein [Leptolyngbya sp. Cla-17]MBM0743372.1 hypothetical protein [Leptolyngbya sp. Cla-17]
MARQLKRWESPRKEGRNDKGRGGSARQRQRKKQFQALRKKLKEQTDNQADSQDNKNQKNQSGEANQLPLSFVKFQLERVSYRSTRTTLQPFFDLPKLA